MDALDEVDWEILDATAEDWENLEQIYLTVCFEIAVRGAEGTQETGYCYRRLRADVLLQEIADRIRNLVTRGVLGAVDEEDGRPITDPGDLGYVWRAWFRMTPQGQGLWESSEHGALWEQEHQR